MENARRPKVLARIELFIAKINGVSSVIEEKLEEVHISDTLIKQQREAAAAAAAASISPNPDI
jgi:ribosomal protein L12E/L44/L45/RPP1/RPP2